MSSAVLGCSARAVRRSLSLSVADNLRVQAAHLLTIPWENCTLVIPELRDSNDTPLATDFTVERLLDKMVRRQRCVIYTPRCSLSPGGCLTAVA